MNVFSEFLLSKSKKSLSLVAVGLLAISSANAKATDSNLDPIVIDSHTTSTVDFSGDSQNLNITKTGSISVDDNDSSVYTDGLKDHFIRNDGNISTTVENNSSDAEADGIYIKHRVDHSNITNNGNITISATYKGNDSDAYAYATGIDIDNEDNNTNYLNITNNKNIAAIAKSNSSDADSAGIYLGGAYGSRNNHDATIINNGNIAAIAKSNGDDVYANAGGIITINFNHDSTILNNGIITAIAEGDDSGAMGIYVDNYENELDDSSIINDGNITVTASNSSDAEAAGIYINIPVKYSKITNSGNITVSATAEGNDSNATAYGINTHNDNNNGDLSYSNITNSGNMTVSATAENNAKAYGIFTDSLYYSNITNSGNITVDADPVVGETMAYGIFTSFLRDSNIINSGNITVSATSESNDSDVEVAGVYIDDGLENSNITNSGNITVSVTAANGAEADGIFTDSLYYSNITNSGNIIVSATAENNDSGVEADGITVNNLDHSNITNSGNITVSANAESNNSDVEADGIYTGSLRDSNITNSGVITVSATAESNDSDAFSSGISTHGPVKYSNIVNSGNVTATVETDGSIAEVYGIKTLGIIDSNITNSGTITAKINNDLDTNGYAIYSAGDSNSTITNTATGKLYGNIHIEGDAKVINKGLIALPYNANPSIGNAAYIGGNLTNTGTIQIGMLTDGKISNTQYSQLKVGGNATFNRGSVLDVNVLNAFTDSKTKLLIGEQLKNVVSSDGNLTVNDLTVTDNSILLNFDYVKNDNNISLNIVKGLSVLDAIIQGGGNSNAMSAGRALDNILNTDIPSGMDNFYGKLNLLSTDTEIAKAVDSTVPYAAVSNIDASNVIINNLFGIVDNQRGSGLNSGDKLFREKRVWVKPFGNFGKQKDKDTVHGFDFSATGIGMGADGEYSDNAYVGLGFFYNKANVDVNGVAQSSDLDIYTALIYGKTPIASGKAILRYKASASWQKTDSSRYMALTNETASSSYTSKLYALDLRVEKETKIYDNLSLEPIIGATYKYIHSPSYTESGSSVDLSTDSSNTKRLTTYLGSKAYYQINDTSTLNSKINVGYDAVDDDIAIVSAYSAAPTNRFTTNGIDNGRWSYSAAIGYKKELTAQDDINFNYAYYGEGSSYYNNTISLYYLHRF